MSAIRRGNGTGPGTGIPLRRGPPTGKRNVRGMPPNLRTICLRFGGRFHMHPVKGAYYKGGYKKWIHYVDPETYRLPELFQATHMVLRKLKKNRPDNWMKLVWYFQPGAVDHTGLRVIQNEDGIHNMWIDMNLAGANVVNVFMQDAEYEVCHVHNHLLYSIPDEVPVPVGRFNSKGANRQAEIWLKMLDSKGEEAVGMKEILGDRWYIADTEVPMANVQTGVELRPRKGRKRNTVPLTSGPRNAVNPCV